MAEVGSCAKKDLEKHKEEMRNLQDKVSEEKERLRFLKESGEMEEFSPPNALGAASRFTSRRAFQISTSQRKGLQMPALTWRQSLLI